MNEKNLNTVTRWHKYRYAIFVVMLLAFYIPLDILAGYLTLSVPMPLEFDGYRKSHAYYHHDLSPNFHGNEEWGNNKYSVKTNSMGFKDSKNRFIEPRSNTYRIVFLGDSFTEGIGLPYEETFVGIIAKQLEAKDIDVFNAGVVSYSPKLYYLKVKHLIEERGFRFDELHVFIDISDAQDEIIREDFVPGQLAGGRDFFRLSQENIESALFKEYVSVFDYSLAARFMNYKVRGQTTPQSLAKTRASEIRWPIPEGYGKNFQKLRGAWLTNAAVFEKWGRKGLALSEINMALLAELCKQHDIKLVIAAYPWPLQIFKQVRGSPQETLWEAFRLKYDLEFLNLFPVFIDGTNPLTVISNLYIPNDVHWNGAGHKLVAETWLERFLVPAT